MAARKKNETTTYAEASDELETILQQIEDGSADVDVLGERVERAAELIRVCREKLSGTEARVTKIVDELAALTAGGGKMNGGGGDGENPDDGGQDEDSGSLPF